MTPEACALAIRLLLDGAYLALSSSATALREVDGGGYVACTPTLDEWEWTGATATLTHTWKLNHGVQEIAAWFLVRIDPRAGQEVVLQSGRLRDEDGKERPCRVVVNETPVSVTVTAGEVQR